MLLNSKEKLEAYKEKLLILVMDQRRDLFKDNFDSGLQIIEQFLGSAERQSQHITKLLNLPLYFYRKQTLTAPYFTLSLPNSCFQDRIDYKHNIKDVVEYKKERRRHIRLPTACLTTTKPESKEEPLLFECSAASLNLLTGDTVGSRGMGKHLPRQRGFRSSPKSSKDNLAVFTLTEGDDSSIVRTDSLTFLSTSSSNSSTREYYLPATSGSNDTFKVADVLSLEKTKPFLPIQNEAYRSTYPDLRQKPIRPPKISSYEFSNNSLSSPEYNHRDGLEIQNNILLTNYQEIQKKSLNSNQLSVIVQNNNCSPIPIIKIDKLYDEVLMKINEIQRESDAFLKTGTKASELCKEKYTINSGRIVDEDKMNRTLPNSKIPSPLDWVKEIKEHKYILEQDIIENNSLNSSTESSTSALYLNNKSTFSNSVNKIYTMEKEDVFISCEDHLERKENIIGNKNNTAGHLKKNIIEPNKISQKNEQKINSGNLVFVSAGNTRVKPLSAGSTISCQNVVEKLELEDYSNSKFKKLSGIFNLSSQSPGVTKLLIPSDLVIEGSGSGSEDDITTLQRGRRKQRSFKKVLNNVRRPFEEFGEKEPSKEDYLCQINNYNNKVTTEENKRREMNKRSNNRNNPEDAYVYSETLITDEYNFQKLREKFELKNNISDKNVNYTSIFLQKADEYSYRNVNSVKNNFDSKEREKEIFGENEAAVNVRIPTDDQNYSSKENKNTEINEENTSLEDIEKIVEKEKSNEKNINNISLGIDLGKIEEKERSSEETDKSKRGRLITKNGLPALLYDETGFPLTDMKGRLLKNNLGIPLLNVKSYQEVITKQIIVYDANNISVNDLGFNPSKTPEVSTIAKVTDQVGNPTSLYNNIGLPLTDEEGLLLHDSKGEILVSLDSRFFPLCCKNGTSIYLRNGSTWLSQRYKYIVTTQNRVNDFEKKSQQKPESFHDFINDGNINDGAKCISSPVRTALVNRSHTSNNAPPTKKTACTQYDEYEGGSDIDSSSDVEFSSPYKQHSGTTKHNEKQTAAEIIVELLYNKLKHNKTEPFGMNKREMLLNKPKTPKEINRLSGKYSYPLYNGYRNPLQLLENCGWAVSDTLEPGFNSNQRFRRLQKSKHKISNPAEAYAVGEKWLEPERPYCELQHCDGKGKAQHFRNSVSPSRNRSDNVLKTYSQAEPLVKIIKKKDIRAWDINNEVPFSVKSIYSLPRNTRRQFTIASNAGCNLQSDDHRKNGRCLSPVNYYPAMNEEGDISHDLGEETSTEDCNYQYGPEIEEDYDDIYDEDISIDDYFPLDAELSNLQRTQSGLPQIQRHSRNQYYQQHNFH